MLRQRKLRDRLVAMAAPPVLVALAAAVGALVLADGQNSTQVGLIALAAAIVVAAWSFLVGWTLIRSVNSLAIAADGLAEAQLRIANGELEASELPGIDHGGPADEIGRVAEAVDAISRSAVDMAESHRESIRKGLATIVINLARRNQSLLDRQVEYLDKLEQTEEDPDRLGELFRVDHLATRMRRNAESLLVLAGADTVKRKGAPVAMSDVLRVAIGEVENYQHIELGIIEDGEVPAGVAVDLAHLSAELMENATQFSPPSTAVEVSAVIDRPTQSFRISIADRGMGLGDRLELANETLANPPELGLGMGRSLGFMVIGRLARRLGATVQLRLNDGGGTIADVDVPLALFQLEDGDQPEPAQEPASAQTPPPVVAPSPDSPPVPVQTEAAAPQAETQSQTQSQSTASTALDKLLGIAPKTSAPGPVEAPAEVPVVESAPLNEPAVLSEPAPVGDVSGSDTSWQQSSPFGEADLVAAPDSVPPPADDPTWGSMTVESGPTADLSWSQEAAPAPVPAEPVADEPSWTPPPMPPASAKRDDAPSSWTPPPMPAPNPVDESWAPPTAAPPSRLEEAVPSGDAFESGVASLLSGPESAHGGATDTGWPDTSPGAPEPPSGLQRRERGASNVPIGQGRPVAAPSRSPEEVRAMLSRYRDGLKDGKQGSVPGSPDAHDDKDGER